LALLSETAVAESVVTVIQEPGASSPAHIIGSGRMAEVTAIRRDIDIDVVIADSELTPSQIGDIETIADARVLDRTMVITRYLCRKGKVERG
jgi:GTPases